MTNYIYKIVMHTPLGQRTGTMEFSLFDNRFTGFLKILGSKHALKGEVLDNGDCVVRGSIVTLVRTIDFIANGYFDESKINLELHGQRHIYKIDGEIYSTFDIDK